MPAVVTGVIAPQTSALQWLFIHTALKSRARRRGLRDSRRIVPSVYRIVEPSLLGPTNPLNHSNGEVFEFPYAVIRGTLSSERASNPDWSAHNANHFPSSYGVVVVHKPHIPQSSAAPSCPTSAARPTPSIGPAHAHTATEVIVTLWPFSFGVTSQHRLYGHAN